VQPQLVESSDRASMTAQAAAAAREQLQTARGTIAARLKQRADIEQRLPPAPVRTGERARLVTHLEVTEAAAVTAEGLARALATQAPEDSDLARLAADRVAADRALQRYKGEVQELERAIERIEGELEEGLKTGGARKRKELEGELELAEAEVLRIEEDLAALRLLADELGRIEQEQRDKFLQPVTARLEPYLGSLFPSARIGFGSQFELTTLERSGAIEPIAKLSGGTQEQIAVLVRLAFARLMAEAGNAAPVILDDALVYSDDERIERLFSVLQEAGQCHQVIVLTCRSRTFARLGGAQLQLTPWKAA